MLTPNDITPADAARFRSKVDRSPGQGPNGDCHEWMAARTDRGYGRFYVSGKTQRAHRVAWVLDTDQPLSDEVVARHSCDNPPCCNAAHVLPGTTQDNADDRVARGRGPNGDKNGSRRFPERYPRGENHPMAKLTDAEADEIRALHAGGGWTYRALGKRFGVSGVLVGSIIRRRHRRGLTHGMPPGPTVPATSCTPG